MTPEAVLIELLERVNAERGAAVLVSDHELNQWPVDAVVALQSQRLIVKARPATSVVCPGCEQECVMPVHTLSSQSHKPASFIVCDKRSDINRVPVSSERLTQWRCSPDSVCGFVANSMGLRRSNTRSANADLWEIGMATGDKRSQMLCLKADADLTLVAGTNVVPLAECIGYGDGKYSVHATMIRQLVDSATSADNRYTPSVTRREARKLETQAMHKSWQKEYRKLKKKNPTQPDTWYAMKITKMPIAQGRVLRTIRRNMKK